MKGNPQWEALLQFLEGCRWEKRYSIMACDGTQWKLNASRRNRFRLSVYGDNAYPEDFQRFLDLLNAVIAGSGITVGGEKLPTDGSALFYLLLWQQR